MSDDRGPREIPIVEDLDESGKAPDEAGAPSGGDAADVTGAEESQEAGEPEEDAATRLESEIEELQDKLLRKQAELINYRRRVEREREELLDRGRSRVLRELLPIVDDFERAVASEPGDLDAYREGVEMILRSLRETLRKLGVERIEPLGEAFDPQFHEAVERRPVPGSEEGLVVEVYQPGYRLGERLLRPASVVVAAGEPAGDEDSDDDPDSQAEREETEH